MSKKSKLYKNYIYDEILREKLSKDFLINEKEIKETQCKSCEKRNTIRCRLNIRDEKCINYMRRKQQEQQHTNAIGFTIPNEDEE